jgi:hypothetical protein
MTTALTVKWVLVGFVSFTTDWGGTHVLGSYNSPIACQDAGERLPKSVLYWGCIDGQQANEWERRERLLWR